MVFLIGFFAQVGQVIMFREVMALFHGTELLFGVVLGGWVIWAAVGAGAAEFFLKRDSNFFSRVNPLKLLAYSSLLNGFLLGFQVIFLRFYPLVFSTGNIPQAFSFYGAITAVFLALFPFAFLVGVQFTFSLWVNPRKRLGFLYRLESIGAMVGGLLTSFVLVEIASPLRVSFIIGVLFVTGFILIVKQKQSEGGFPPVSKNIRWLQVGTALILFILAVLPIDFDRLSRGIYQSKKGEGFPLLETKESKYGRIEVLKNPKADQYIVFHNNALVSSIEPGLADQYERHLAEICLTQHPSPAHVLLIGGSLSTLPENIVKHGVEELTAVELDPLLLNIFETYSGISRKDPGIRIAHKDGRSFVLNEPGNYYDLVIVFSAEPDNASVNRFCTKEFFSRVNRVLKPGGVFCLFLPTHGAAHEYLSHKLIERTSSVYKAMRSVFKHILAVQVNGHLLMGSQSGHVISIDPEVLAERLASRPGARPFYRFEEKGKLKKEIISEDELPAYFSGLFSGVLHQRDFFSDEEDKQKKGTKFQQQLDISRAKTNRDSHPAAVTYSMMVWEGITGFDAASREKSLLTKVINFIGEGNLSDIIIFPGVLVFVNLVLLIIFFLSRFKGQGRRTLQRIVKNYSIFLAACITGCFSIIAEIILLSLYQSLTGYLYYRVGILMAIFMGGLALGAKLTDRQFKNPWLLLTGVFLMMVLLCVFTGYSSVFLSGVVSKAVVTFVFIFLMLMDGILCGAVFPLLGFLTSDWKRGRPGAWVYAFDLVGAGIGALLIAPFLIPIAGIPNTLVILAILLFSLVIFSVSLAFSRT
ncbi:MAG: fused MFS/spermidine synthase [Candidatus Aminicenantes bacterium]|nr:MAG: fused MFS/spermidine synthase [Candidatus Aminicenantes bacterium]